MHIKPSKIVPIFLRYGVAIFLLCTLIFVMYGENLRTIFSPYDFDERLYHNMASNFTVDHIRYLYNHVLEAKPLPFLILQKVLNSSDPLYTRAFAYLLIGISTYLIYLITNKNKLSFLFILIPIFLDSMWLTAEIVEVTFVLLSIQYANKSGIFIGLATIFRPVAIVYLLIIPNIQKLYVLIIGIIFAGILVSLDLFNAYAFEILNYAKDSFFGIDFFVVIVGIMFLIIGLNKRMFPYCVATLFSFGVKMYPHYFLPIFTYLFIGFLLNMNNDFKEMGIKLWIKEN